MGAGLTIDARFGRRLGLVLALFALVVGIVAPPGFMITPTAQGAALVICTGHGPLQVKTDPDHRGKAPKPSSDAPCAFAGHHVAPAPAITYVSAPRSPARPLRVAKAMIDQTPGRGLVAPPPPSRGPPVRL